MKRLMHAASLLAAAGLFGGAIAARAEGWEWSVTPYAWGASVGVESKVRDQTWLDTKVALADLIDDVDFMAAVHVEGQRGGLGLLFDANYLNVSGGRTIEGLAGVPGDRVETASDLKQTVVEAAATWAPGGEPEGLAFLFGGRAIDFAQTMELAVIAGGGTGRTYRLDPTLFDAMAGIRFNGKIGERGSYQLRADASAGGTEATYNGVAGFGYTLGASGRTSLLAGYRYFEVRLKEKDRRAEVETNLSLAGPYLALRYAF